MEEDRKRLADTNEVLKWLGLAVQALDGARKMSNELKPTTLVKFRAVDIPKIMDPHRQADPMTFITAVIGEDRDAEFALKNLHRVCDEKGWQCLQTDKAETFATSFFGKVHCECILAAIRSIDPNECGLQKKPRQELIKLINGFKVAAQRIEFSRQFH